MNEAFKPDNTLKLSRAQTEDRHLFVWVDPTDQYVTWRAMLDLTPPPPSSNLPVEITSLWIATLGPGGAICYRYDPSGKWDIQSRIQIATALES